ncbi:ovostatin-like [Eleutherodactylus coqui]|uniref:Alpha-2-macroglobulin n=1 Tax=Eleutherodactylus coqui TaxID=57060 RepID=A0A8J6JXP6_ELECQ|nr:hypothetical protein GDO78_021655 [Eleutherodactylus coqui]KAG9472012.1 hypothetical protein GDO78_021655 [Eleutherodactylus coqui]
MRLKGIIPSLVLLCLIVGARSKPRCAFSFPAMLKSGEMAKACVNTRGQTAQVDMILEVSGVNYTVFSGQLPADDIFMCPEFQVPLVSVAAPVFLTVSAIAPGYDYQETQPVVMAPTGKITLIQLEKSIYKPGETVRLNLISIDNNLYPADELFPLIFVTDPSGNRLYQWTNQQTINSMLRIEFVLLSDPELGPYEIHVQKGGKGSSSQISKSFVVDEYVLPNMQLEILAANAVTILDKTLPYKVITSYTYGQGVLGKVSGRACRAPVNYYIGNACNRNPDGLCIPITGTLDANGTFSGELDMTNFQFDRSGYRMALTLYATVTEQGTGIQVAESKTISITNQLGQVYFNRENMEPYYKKQLPYFIQATAVDGLQKPISGQIIELQVNGVTVKNLTTDVNGKVQDYIDTSVLEQSVVNIQVIYKNSEQCYDSTYVVPTYSNDYFSITRFYSRSGSFLQIEGPKEELQCGQTYILTVKYTFSQLGLTDGETQVSLNYMTMSRLKIVNFGTLSADLTNSTQGELPLSLEITPEHAPVTDVIVYALLDEEVVAHTIQLNIEKCFRNQVSMDFSEERATPGSTINLNIASSPRSVCGVRIYDSSLLLLQQDQPLTPSIVYSSLLYSSLNGYSAAGYNVDPASPPCIDANKQIMFHGLYYSPTSFPNEGDSYQELKSVGMLMLTHAPSSQPTLCGQPAFIGRPPIFNGDFLMTNSATFAREPGAVEDMSFTDGANNGGSPAAIQSVRTRFPEMMFFNITYTNENGLLSVPLEVPGTITKWEGDMVCLSGNGIGMTKNPSNFTSFQPFFLSVSLPYSIVRGEDLMIRVTVANNLEKCVKVNVTMAHSDDYTTEAVNGNDIQCICSGQRGSFSFILKAKSLGVLPISITGETLHIGDTCDGPADPNEAKRIDTVVRSIIVEPEGIPQEATKSTFICTNDENVVTEVNILPPAKAVQDATTAKISVIGDILGRALVNPESLIKEPTGCGEQNLATLMPIALVINCLNITGRLTQEMKDKAVQFMNTGYMRQMRFRKPDGSFSAFQYGESSSELTLKTLLTLWTIKDYVYVEPRVMNQALVYLESLFNRKTGGFTPRGTVFNNALKGGAEDDVSFTAQMAAYLIKTNDAGSPTLLRQALSFLDTASRGKQSIYNKAWMFYVFQLAKNEERSNAMLEELEAQKIEEDGTTHWERVNKPSQSTPYMFSPPAASANVEITATVLLALCTKPSPTPADLSYMSQIALWLAEQQNDFGSYSSTSDTMMALEALSAYGTLVYQKGASNTVAVKYGGTVVKEFNLDPENRDLFQTQPLSNIPGDYSIIVSGKGCVLVQTTVSFNMPVNDEDSDFSLSVYIPPESCVNGEAPIFPVYMNISYNGLRNESNMAIIDVALPSGYTPEQESLSQLKSKVPKVEQKNNHVYIYLLSVTRDVTSLEMKLQMGARVQNMQPKYIYAWDYYEKDENARAVLRHPCTIPTDPGVKSQ